MAALSCLYYKKDQVTQSQQSQTPYFHVAYRNEPKFEKRYKGGEDAWLISDDRKFIVACDGVGGWGDLDICSGIYSKWLCKELARLYNENFAEKNCKKMMQEAADNSPHQGSTTVVMAHLHD